jgi:hypothetical protein
LKHKKLKSRRCSKLLIGRSRGKIGQRSKGLNRHSHSKVKLDWEGRLNQRYRIRIYSRIEILNNNWKGWWGNGMWIISWAGGLRRPAALDMGLPASQWWNRGIDWTRRRMLLAQAKSLWSHQLRKLKGICQRRGGRRKPGRLRLCFELQLLQWQNPKATSQNPRNSKRSKLPST